MADLSQRPSYSREQLSRYLKHINMDDPKRKGHTIEDLEKSIQDDPLGTLTLLQRKQLAAVSFDNLVLHYSQHHSISLDPQLLFHKVVERGFGGYCMENNCFFATVLRSLGYQLYTAGARVSHAMSGSGGGGYEGWSHMVTIVTIKSRKYMVDVGFGPQVPTEPVPLEELNEGQVIKVVPTAEARLIKDNIAPNTDSSQRLWVYQYRNNADSGWQPAYCFTELEFLPVDYEVMSFKTSQSRTSWFTYRLVCVKMILDEEQEKVVGTMVLVGNEVKKRLHGKMEHLKNCETENDRIEALREWFGVNLNDEEVRGIRGMVSQLGSS